MVYCGKERPFQYLVCHAPVLKTQEESAFSRLEQKGFCEKKLVSFGVLCSGNSGYQTLFSIAALISVVIFSKPLLSRFVKGAFKIILILKISLEVKLFSVVQLSTYL